MEAIHRSGVEYDRRASEPSSCLRAGDSARESRKLRRALAIRRADLDRSASRQSDGALARRLRGTRAPVRRQEARHVDRRSLDVAVQRAIEGLDTHCVRASGFRYRGQERYRGADLVAVLGRRASLAEHTVKIEVPQDGRNRAARIRGASRENGRRASGRVRTASRVDRGSDVGDRDRVAALLLERSRRGVAGVPDLDCHRPRASRDTRAIATDRSEEHETASLVAVVGAGANLAVVAIGVEVPLVLERREHGGSRKHLERGGGSFVDRARHVDHSTMASNS